MQTEQELAAAVVAHFAPLPVYQEVHATNGATADIVIDMGGRGWVIECKLTLGLDVIGQAIRWKEQGVAVVSVAVPVPRATNRTIWAAQTILKRWGIGLIYVEKTHYPVNNSISFHVREVFPGVLHRCRPFRMRQRWEILNECREDHKTFCPAGSQSGRWSQFKDTVERVRKHLLENGPKTLGEIIAEVKTHYANTASARRCLAMWLPDPKVCPGITRFTRGNQILFAAVAPTEKDSDGKIVAKTKRRSARKKTS